MLRQRTFLDIDNATSSPESEDGHLHCDSLDGQTTGTAGQALAPASHSQSPESEQDKPTSGTSGPISSVSSASAALQASLESKLKARFALGGSMEYSETWKEKVTPAGRRYWAHTASARRTSGKDFTGVLEGWPTPNAMEGGSTSRGGDRKDEMLIGGLVHGLTGWPSPDTANRERSEETQAKCEQHRKDKYGKNTAPIYLADTAKLTGWATPRNEDSEQTGAHRGTADTLHSQTQLAGLTTSSSTAETKKSGVLDPAFSRWLQGFPSSWDQASPGFKEWQSSQDAIALDASKPTATP